MKKALVFLLIVLIHSSQIAAQKPEVFSTAEIAQALQRLQVLGTVLYVAAHPDDENTRLITYLNNEEKYRTGYLSLTRGDGGQNLIGSDMREKLGIIRTQELLQARSVDGGDQFFSRANDFGYSKNPDETFNTWDREKVLADMVFVIRTYQPDVIITRFNTEPGTTHGHHTASAILAHEAFAAAADPSRFPEQLAFTNTWQAERLLWNTSSWFYKDKSDFDTSGLIKIDVGLFNPYLGKSYTEIAAESRSMHKSQGFGAALTRGSSVEYLRPELGSEPSSKLFEGISTSWSRVKGGAEIGKMVKNLNAKFNIHKPSEIVPELLNVYKAIHSMPDNPYKESKLEEVKNLLKACMGLYLEITTSEGNATPGDSIILMVEAIQRSGIPVHLQSVGLLEGQELVRLNKRLDENEKFLEQVLIKLPDTLSFSQPYWLKEPSGKGMFRVGDQKNIGKAENDPALLAKVMLLVEGVAVNFQVPVAYKFTEPSEGEVYQPFAIIPPVAVNSRTNKILFTTDAPKELVVEVIAGRDSVNGLVSVRMPAGWEVEPANFSYDFLVKGASKTFRFQISAPQGSEENFAEIEATYQGKTYNRGLEFIRYSHIPTQVYLPEAKVKLVNMDLSKRGEKIAYIMGAGDDIPESLRLVGYQVDVLQTSEMELSKLDNYDAVVLGIRALNTIPELRFRKKVLEAYARKGGTVVIQYNTSFGLIDEDFTPDSLRISRKRVTSENAPVKLLNPQHPVFQAPNKISHKDFEGWVQERGLYFPDGWSSNWTPLISSHDPGEEPLEGGLLVAKVGSGYYIYTGYSWFRQLPAGVPGAYRIFVNLLSLGKSRS